MNHWELEGAKHTVGKRVASSLEVHTKISNNTELKTLGSTTTLVPLLGRALKPAESDAQGQSDALKHGSPAPPGRPCVRVHTAAASLYHWPLALSGPLLNGLAAWLAACTRHVAHKNAFRNGGILTMRVCPFFCLATGAELDRHKHEYEWRARSRTTDEKVALRLPF